MYPELWLPPKSKNERMNIVISMLYFDERYIELHDRIGKVCDIADQVNDLAVEVN